MNNLGVALDFEKGVVDDKHFLDAIMLLETETSEEKSNALLMLYKLIE